MYIPIMLNEINPSVDYNKWLKRLDTELNEPTNKNSLKAHKVVKLTNRKKLL